MKTLTAHTHSLTQEQAKQFCFAGKSTFTLKNENSGNRFTFKVTRPNDNTPWFVSVLTGSDNESSFSFIGTVFGDQQFYHGKKSKISKEAGSVKTFEWFAKMLFHGVLPPFIKVYHEGKCGRCGRKLTVPESIISGLGPKCAGFTYSKGLQTYNKN